MQYGKRSSRQRPHNAANSDCISQRLIFNLHMHIDAVHVHAPWWPGCGSGGLKVSASS